MNRALGIDQTPVPTGVQKPSFDTLGKCSCGDPATYSSVSERRAHSATHDLPDGYRWATEEEMDRPDAVVVKRTYDSSGQPYTQDEADLAVPALPLFKVEVLVEIRAENEEAAYDAVSQIMSEGYDHDQDIRSPADQPWHWEMFDDAVRRVEPFEEA